MENCKYQHGDVILKKVCEIPNGFKKIEIAEDFIVEKGAGLHTHVLKNVKNCEVYKNGFGELLFEVKSLSAECPVTIYHEEHGPMILEPGIYIKEIENEYDAETDEQYKTRD